MCGVTNVLSPPNAHGLQSPAYGSSYVRNARKKKRFLDQVHAWNPRRYEGYSWGPFVRTICTFSRGPSQVKSGLGM